MKICYLNHDLGSKTGAGRFYSALISSLKKINSDLEYQVLTHDNFLPKKMWQLPASILKIRNAFKNCEVIHALDGWPYGFIAVLASLGLKKKLIITAIGTGAVQPLYSFWKRPLMKWAYRKAGSVTAVSNNTKKEILKVMPSLKIEVINHGVDYEKFKNSLLVSYFLNLKSYILSVGALKKRKGFDYSIAAFAEVAKKLPELKYVIVGDGPEKEKLVRQLAERYEKLGIKDRVVFLENLSEEELIAAYKNAELFILLSQDVNKDIEGFGLVFLEAAAAGLPIVAARETSAEDAVVDGKNGILVPASDFEAASEAMEKILQNKNLKESFSKASLDVAKSMSWEKSAKGYAALY